MVGRAGRGVTLVEINEQETEETRRGFRSPLTPPHCSPIRATCCISAIGTSQEGSGERFPLPIFTCAFLGIPLRSPMNSFLNISYGSFNRSDSPLWPGLFQTFHSNFLARAWPFLSLGCSSKMEGRVKSRKAVVVGWKKPWAYVLG